MSSLRALAAAFALGACCAPAFAAAQAAPAAEDHRVVLPTGVTPDHYDILIKPDVGHMTFSGEVSIDLTVRSGADRLVMNDADLVIDKVALAGAKVGPAITYDAKAETVSLAFGEPLRPGRYKLTLDYHGLINRQASGLFALDYKAGGKTQKALFTQFENSDARRFAPCWDEPADKATFTLSVVAPAHQMAVSNMPVAATKALPGGLKQVRFARTPKMSTYLLFLGLGDFERIHKRVGKTDVGVIVRRGDTADGRFALDAATRLLPYYNDYFGTPYPLPKLDLIAGPGSSAFFSAMENWGAIFSFESDFLVDPRVSTEGDRQNVFVTVAHEMAHQWFGDLVTMEWWDDLWLNEGFASWMENKATDHFHPEWRLWLQALNEKDDAMESDARSGSHPVITPINDVLQADSAFDEITYSKGSSVIRMFEAYLGEDAFRAGVRRYIADHAYGNTTSDDLWRDMDPASPAKPITAMAHAFTLQTGVPLIRELDAGCTGGRESVDLAQDRLVEDGPALPTAWPVPVNVAPVAGQAQSILVKRPADAKVELPTCGPALINAGQAGYFRSLYTAQQRQALIAAFPTLSSDDQLGLLNDFRSLGYAGEQPMAGLLALTRRAGPATDPIVWQRIADKLVDMDRLYHGQTGQDRFRAYARQVLQPALAAIGWDARPGESDNTALMRASVLNALGRLGDPAVVTEAHQRFERYMSSPSSLTAATRKSVLAIVAEHADASDWAAIHTLAQTASTELERRDLYVLLGRAADPALAQRALDLALSGEPAATTAPAMITAVADLHPDLALGFVVSNWPKVSLLIEPDERSVFAPDLLRTSADMALAAKLDAFGAATFPVEDQQDARKADAGVAYRAGLQARRLPEIDRWLANAG